MHTIIMALFANKNDATAPKHTIVNKTDLSHSLGVELIDILKC